MLDRRSGCKGVKVFSLEQRNRVGCRLEVVEKMYGPNPEDFTEISRLQAPGKVRRLGKTVDHRSGDVEAGGIHAVTGLFEKLADHSFKPRVVVTVKLRLGKRHAWPVLRRINCKVGLSAAHVTCEQLQRRCHW